MVLKTEDLVFARGEDGQLIAQEVEIETGGTVKVKPLTRGKLQEIYAKATSSDIKEKLESDNEVLKSGLAEPILSEKDLIHLKPQIAAAISTAIIAVSMGISQEEVKDQAQKVIADQEIELKKNLVN